jgi:hypothetical protein
LLLHKLAERSITLVASILCEPQGVPVGSPIVSTREQPLWVDGKLAHYRRDRLDEERRVDGILALLDKPSQRIGFQMKCRRDVFGRMTGLSREDSAHTVGDCLDEGVVVGQRHRVLR